MKLKILEDLAAQASQCTVCDLHLSREKSVFARGNPEASLVFVGEAPGAEENKQGIPFCGRSGKLLDRMIAAMNLTPDQVYIMNTVKCRPPDNRKPTPKETESCKPFFIQQLMTVNPKVIIALGASATEALLGPGPNLTKRRELLHSYNNIPVVVTFHPAFLLRNPPAKEDAALDLKKALQFLKEHNESQV